MPSKVTAGWARRHGFTVDSYCYPWLAYKGPRFNPTETRQCLTDSEANAWLLVAAAVVYALVEFAVFTLFIGGGLCQ